jgi:putative ABC transport system substrate-binding protein
MNRLFAFIISCTFLFFLSLPIQAKSTQTIGIVIPIQHQAMNEIVAGFKQTLQQEYPYPVTVLVRNASSDINLQRAIIEELRTRGVNLLVPITTNATLMTLTMVPHIPIVSIASNYTEKQRKYRHPCNVAAVNDSIPPEAQLDFIQRLMPHLTQVTIVHSADDKVIQEVNTFLSMAKARNITVQDLMIQQLSDLYAMASKISPKSQLIFVFKDNLVASGIHTLVQQANHQKIPLITSDDGTVENGAAIGIGVQEYHLGVLGAKIQVLQGQNPCQIPIHKVSQLSVFINSTAMRSQGVSLADIQAAAATLHYTVVNSHDLKGAQH